MSNDSEKS